MNPITVNPWLAAALAFITVGGGGGIGYLLTVRGTMRKTDAETGLTNTEAAAQLSDSWAKLVAALEGQVSNAVSRANAASEEAAESQRQAQQSAVEAKTYRDQVSDLQEQVTQLSGQVSSMREQIISLELELADRG